MPRSAAVPCLNGLATVGLYLRVLAHSWRNGGLARRHQPQRTVGLAERASVPSRLQFLEAGDCAVEICLFEYLAAVDLVAFDSQ